MADIVDLRTRQPTSHDDEFSSQLVQDLARYSEGLASEEEIRRRYRFDESTWAALGENEDLFAAVSEDRTRRVRSGQLKRELSQRLVTQAPNVLGEILLAKDANPRHRIDAARALDDFCANPAEVGPAGSEKFSIVINIGDETLRFEKNLSVDVNPKIPDAAAPLDEWLPMIPSKKDDSGGNNTL